MGETGSALGSVRRSTRTVKNPKKDGTKVTHSDDDFELVEKEEEEEDWDPGAGRKTTERVVVVVERSPKRGHKGKTSSKQTAELMGFDAVMDAVSHDLGSLKLSNARARNSRAAGIVLNAVSQASVAMDRSQEGIMERSFAYTGLHEQEAPGTSSRCAIVLSNSHMLRWPIRSSTENRCNLLRILVPVHSNSCIGSNISHRILSRLDCFIDSSTVHALITHLCSVPNQIMQFVVALVWIVDEVIFCSAFLVACCFRVLLQS